MSFSRKTVGLLLFVLTANTIWWKFTCLSAWNCLPFLEILLHVVRGALSPQKSVKLVLYILASKQFFFRGFLSCCSYLIRNNTLFLQILLICMSIIYFKMISYFGEIKWWKNMYLRIDSIKYLSLYSFPFLFILTLANTRYHVCTGILLPYTEYYLCLASFLWIILNYWRIHANAMFCFVLIVCLWLSTITFIF